MQTVNFENVTFPVAFSTSSYSVVVSMHPSDNTSSATGVTPYTIGTMQKTYFDIGCRGGAPGFSATWIAIGK